MKEHVKNVDILQNLIYEPLGNFNTYIGYYKHIYCIKYLVFHNNDTITNIFSNASFFNYKFLNQKQFKNIILFFVKKITICKII
jgi:hypothetical protein